MLNIDVGNVNVQVKVAESVSKLLETYVDQRFATEMSALRNELRDRKIPDAQGAVE